MELTIKISKDDCKYSYDSVKSLLRKFKELEKSKDKIKQFTFNLLDIDENCSELSLAIIWRYALFYRELKCQKKIIYPKSKKRLFIGTHFFDRLTGDKDNNFNSFIPIHFETFTPLRPVIGQLDTEIEKIISETIKGTLETNNEFHKEIKTHIIEVLNNAFDHSESTSDAGSVCIVKSRDEMTFCTIDMGQGIKRSFLDNPNLKEEYIKKPDQDIIFEATNFKVSCNPENKRNPKYNYSNGGIGLYFLREFIRLHKNCQLVIISNKGYYYINSQGKEKKRNFVDTQWPGTIVFFTVQLNQKKSIEYQELSKKYIDERDVNYLNIVK